jgi:hypothetical protein
MIPPNFQKHNSATLKLDALWLSNNQHILNSNATTVNTCRTKVP